MKTKISILVFVFFLSTSYAQTKKQLKIKKQKIEKNIELTNELLFKTKQNKSNSLTYINTLSKQIQNQEFFLDNLNTEINIINVEIKKSKKQILNIEDSIFKKSNELKLLKDEYANMIYALQKNKNNKNNFVFIVSSEDFNQAYRRVLYIKQYSIYRKKQAKKINKTQQDLRIKKNRLIDKENKLSETVTDKKNLIREKKQEIEKLDGIKKEKNILIKKLIKSEKLFIKQINEQKAKAQELENEIRKIIEEEIRKSKEMLKNGKSEFSLTPELKTISTDFKKNLGRLPWPLLKGVIVKGYGKQKHPIFKGVETVNNGIDIATTKNASVRSVFDGVVVRIFFIKGEGKAVLISHGDYFTVYSGLKEVFIKQGDRVLEKEKIGVVLTKEQENTSELHFEIWKGYEKQNPSVWLYDAY